MLTLAVVHRSQAKPRVLNRTPIADNSLQKKLDDQTGTGEDGGMHLCCSPQNWRHDVHNASVGTLLLIWG